MVINNNSLGRRRDSELARLRKELLESGDFLVDEEERKKKEQKQRDWQRANNRLGKTPEMEKAEERLGRPIEELLDGSRNAKEVARELEITLPTVSNWRKRLGIKSDYFFNRLKPEQKVKEEINE